MGELSIQLQFFSIFLESAVKLVSSLLGVSEIIFLPSNLGFHLLDGGGNLLIGHAFKFSHGL